ncbi:hypothetical protein ACFL21_04800, partial [Patescibacteria group bacterium]
ADYSDFKTEEEMQQELDEYYKKIELLEVQLIRMMGHVDLRISKDAKVLFGRPSLQREGITEYTYNQGEYKLIDEFIEDDE